MFDLMIRNFMERNLQRKPAGGCGSDAFMPFRVLIATCGICSRDEGIAPTGAHKSTSISRQAGIIWNSSVSYAGTYL
jgi:hypothetical protein